MQHEQTPNASNGAHAHFSEAGASGNCLQQEGQQGAAGRYKCVPARPREFVDSPVTSVRAGRISNGRSSSQGGGAQQEVKGPSNFQALREIGQGAFGKVRTSCCPSLLWGAPSSVRFASCSETVLRGPLAAHCEPVT